MTLMKRGKHICNQLKAVRRQIADENGIPLEQRECTHTGPCRGTCPYCEAEMRFLEQALTRRLAMGKVATVAGLTLSLAACGGGEEKTLRTDAPLDTPRTMERTSGNEEALPPDSTLVEGLEPSEKRQQNKCKEEELTEIVLGISVIDEMPENPDSAAVCNKMTSEDEFEEGEMPFVFAEEEASFPGGWEALTAFINKNLQFPEEGRQGMATGTVVVKFIVEKDGSITHVSLLRDIGAGCGKEAVRLVKSMPKWIPGKQNGKPVRSEYRLPIEFDLK